MKILVLGARGNMGRRYCAILRHLGQEVVEADIGDRWTDLEFDKAIVATPTPGHAYDCLQLAMRKKSFLCEKPLSTNPREIEDLILYCEANGVDGRMVCNWKFAGMPAGCSWLPGFHEVNYSNWRTGSDGTAWDCIQLIYLAKGGGIKIEVGAPCFRASIDYWHITLENIEQSYIKMVDYWLNKPSALWSLEDAKKATQKVLRYMEENK